MNDETLLVIFVALTGFALLVQAIVMLVAFLCMRKTVSLAAIRCSRTAHIRNAHHR